MKGESEGRMSSETCRISDMFSFKQHEGQTKIRLEAPNKTDLLRELIEDTCTTGQRFSII